MNRTLTILLALGLLLLAMPGIAAVYKWVDKDGNVHFGNAPPPTSEPEKLSPGRPKPPTTSETPEAPQPEPPPPDQMTIDEVKSDGNTDEAAVKKAEYCERAQANLKLLLSGQRLRVKEGEEYHFMTDEERALRIDETQKQIQQFCN